MPFPKDFFQRPELWTPEEFYIHPALVAAGVTRADFPVYASGIEGVANIKGRAELEGFDLPYCSGNEDRRKNWPNGEPEFYTKPLDPGAITRGQNGYQYVKFQGSDVYQIVADDGTWHGERERDDEARDAANAAWKKIVDKLAG